MEFELKFQVPPQSRAAVERAVATTSAQRTRLRAMYADTAEQRLAQAGLALRLRQEGRRWVQTLKGRGDGLAARLEHEVVLPRRPAAPDPALHAGTEVGELLVAALGGPQGALPLLERFSTDIQRTHRVLRLPGGAWVELALDVGHIVAGARRHPVCELEFELLRGPPDALMALAERWVQRHALWLDVRTKSEIGHRLADGVMGVPATLATQPRLSRRMPPAEAFALALGAGLQHLLPNQAELATDGVVSEAREEHLHQWRVAVRRLRSVLRVLAPWSTLPAEAAALEAHWGEAVAVTSATRDADVVASLLAAPLAELGLAPVVAPIPVVAAASPQAFRSPQLTQLVLRTLRAATPTAPVPVPASDTPPGASLDTPAKPAPRTDLRQLARERCRQAAKKPWPQLLAFDKLTIEERHRLRKQLKRLRYSSELLGSVLPARALMKTRRRLREALESLGHCNDLAVAAAQLAQATAATDAEPAAWFARGWVLGRRQQLDAEARAALRRLARSRPVWR